MKRRLDLRLNQTLKNMEKKINQKLNEAFNKYANCDAPMWCEAVSECGRIAYLTWHQYEDKFINVSHFKACALIILAEFDNIDIIQSPWWGLSRDNLIKSVKIAREKALNAIS